MIEQSTVFITFVESVLTFIEMGFVSYVCVIVFPVFIVFYCALLLAKFHLLGQ